MIRKNIILKKIKKMNMKRVIAMAVFVERIRCKINLIEKIMAKRKLNIF